MGVVEVKAVLKWGGRGLRLPGALLGVLREGCRRRLTIE